MVHHVDLVVSSLERSLPFYEALLWPLGYDGTSEIVGEHGERVVYVDPPGDETQVGLRERRAGPEAADRYAIGLHHLAFAAPSRAVVDEVAAVARDLGAETEGAPHEYDYTPGYYALFIHDPDGIKLEFINSYGLGPT